MAKKLPAEVKLIQEHETLKLDYSKQKNISYSQLATYVACPNRWHLLYREKLQIYEPSIHTLFGTAFHETVQEWLHMLYNVGVKAANQINLHGALEAKMKSIYKAELEKTGKHFSTAEQMGEFLMDGCAILDYLVKNRAAYFNTKTGWLVGCEIPLMIQPVDNHAGVLFKGFMDIVLWNENTKCYEILDLKTSTKGWDDKTKRDDLKSMQLLLYKEYFAKQFGVDKKKIQVKFVILKRKVYTNPYSGGLMPHIQEFVPQTGPRKTKTALEIVEMFVKDCFTQEGKYTAKDLPHAASKENCKFCAFKNQKHLCFYGVE